MRTCDFVLVIDGSRNDPVLSGSKSASRNIHTTDTVVLCGQCIAWQRREAVSC